MSHDHVNELDLYILNGFACCWNGLDFSKEACGVANNCQLVCCFHDCCCKMGAYTYASGCFYGEELQDGDPSCLVCALPCCETGCKGINDCQCMLSQVQCCCFAQQCALP